MCNQRTAIRMYVTGATVALDVASMARAQSSSSSGISTETNYGLKRPRTPQPVQFSPPKPALERNHFLSLYDVFCNLTEQGCQESITVRRYQLDVHELWSAVRQQGGYKTVNLRKLWAATARSFRHPPNWTNASYYFRTAYEQLGLHKMEDMLDAGALSLGSSTGPSAPPQMQSASHQSDLQTLQNTALQSYIGTATHPSMCDELLHTHDARQQRQQQQQQLIQPPYNFVDGTSFIIDVAGQQAQQQQQQPPGAAAQQMPTTLPARPLDEHPRAAVTAASTPARAVAAAAAGIPSITLKVACGQVFGLYDVLRQRIACMCNACVNTAGPDGLDMSPMEFEKHAGWGSYKKWKKSITVKETGCSLGTWLRDHGLEVLSQAAKTRRARLAARAQVHGADVLANAAAGAVAAGALAGAQQQQQQQQLQQVPQQWQSLQWQVSGELPPSNNLAGMPAGIPHIQRRVPTAAAPPHITAAAEPAPAMAEAAVAAKDISREPPGLPSMQQAQQPDGDQLVGQNVEVWSRMDDTWFAATVQAYDPVSQLYLLRFEDGELETLDLAAEQWRVAYSQVHGQMHGRTVNADQRQQQQQQRAVSLSNNWHPPVQAQSPAAAVPPDGIDSGCGTNASSWWEAAQRSLRERPLRVVLDSLTGCLRVLPASEIVQAELHMHQQQQQQHGSHVHLQGQLAGLEHNISMDDDGTPIQLRAAAEPSAGTPMDYAFQADAAAGAGSNISPCAAAAPAAEAEADASAVNRDSSVTDFSLQYSPAVAAAEASMRAQRALEAACRPPRPFVPTKPVKATGLAAATAAPAAGVIMHSVPLDLGGPGFTTSTAAGAAATAAVATVAPSLGGYGPAAVAAAAAAGGASVPDIPVDVVCKHKRGTYLIKANGVVCHCVTCVEQHTRTGALMAWSPAEFERHAGMGGQRKWRNSIKVVLGDKKRLSLGTWLVYFEQQRMQQQLAAQHQQGEGTHGDQQQQQQLLLQQQEPQGFGNDVQGLAGGLQQVHANMCSMGPLLQPPSGQQQQQQEFPPYPVMSVGFPAPAAPLGYLGSGAAPASVQFPAAHPHNGFAPSVPGSVTGGTYLPCGGKVYGGIAAGAHTSNAEQLQAQQHVLWGQQHLGVPVQAHVPLNEGCRLTMELGGWAGEVAGAAGNYGHLQPGQDGLPAVSASSGQAGYNGFGCGVGGGAGVGSGDGAGGGAVDGDDLTISRNLKRPALVALGGEDSMMFGL